MASEAFPKSQELSKKKKKLSKHKKRIAREHLTWSGQQHGQQQQEEKDRQRGAEPWCGSGAGSETPPGLARRAELSTGACCSRAPALRVLVRAEPGERAGPGAARRAPASPASPARASGALGGGCAPWLGPPAAWPGSQRSGSRLGTTGEHSVSLSRAGTQSALQRLFWRKLPLFLFFCDSSLAPQR